LIGDYSATTSEGFDRALNISALFVSTFM